MLEKNTYINCNFKNEFFEAQTNGIISDSIVQNWTLSALECYKIKSDCNLCPIAKMNYSFKCKMKEVVEILLKTKGLPNEREILIKAREGEEINQITKEAV